MRNQMNYPKADHRLTFFVVAIVTIVVAAFWPVVMP